MYGSSFDFSGVTLPGVGGGINASNAISTDQLAKMNAAGKKWKPDPSGGMSHSHNESILELNKKNRDKREGLVNREYNESCGGGEAMKEIMDRKKSRMASFKELKAKEYKFAEGDSQDSELLSMPLPGGAFAESCKCGGSCPVCREKKRKEAEYREWSSEKREGLKSGKYQGEFAGEGMSFPISSAEDVSAAWSSVGHAKNPRQVMRNILDIAKKRGLEEGLPDSVKKRLEAGESGLPTE